MKCISPLVIKVKGMLTTVPCGKCAFCLKNRSDDWFLRLKKELEYSDSAYFVTLTYSEKYLPEDGSLIKRDLGKFNQRLRMQNIRAGGKKIKYYSVGEYGTESFRPHYHGLYFNLKTEIKEKIDSIWSKGFIKVGTVTSASIRYVTNYIINSKEKKYEKKQPEFAFISKGIGEGYIDTLGKWNKISGKFTAFIEGREVRTPRFYRERLYNRVSESIARGKYISEVNERRDKKCEELRRLGFENPEYELELRMRNYHEFLKKSKKKKL